jgi:uncharacterized LabA/DUF88 family protein
VGKNVAVFVDVANIFYAAKAAGVDIDYVTLLKAGSAGRDLVRAYAYTGLDPDNENQRNFHEFLRRHGYKVVSKDIRKYGDGKVKANLDIELVVDMMKTARNLDVAIVVSGDGDFAPAIRAVQEMGVRVEVVSFRGNTSSDLMDVADLFTDITQIAKVEKGSSRSGRRVADDEQDLSMTEVPDKQSEGTGERGRGRGRTRRTPVAAVAVPASPRGRSRVAPVETGDAPLTVLPGEKLSRAAVAATSVDPDEASLDAAADALEPGDGDLAQGAGDDANTEEGRRRRRRRGGRGRGRARGREEGPFVDAAEGAVREGARTVPVLVDEADDAEDMPAPARRAASAFGSVWDSQIGMPAAGRSTPVVVDDDFDEPAVPEYLIAERRQRDNARGGVRGGGGRGRGGAYAAALDRERFGGGRGSTPSRFQQPAPGVREPNFNRSDRPERIDRGDRPPYRQAPRPAPRPSGDEPWSEVPPEIEAMLRAQLGSRPAARPEPAPTRSGAPAASAGTVAPAPRRGRRPAAAVEAPSEDALASESAGGTAEPAPKARRTAVRRPKAEAIPAVEAVQAEAPARKPTRTSAKAAPRATAGRSKATAAASTADATPSADGTPNTADAPAPKRRVTRRKAASES